MSTATVDNTLKGAALFGLVGPPAGSLWFIVVPAIGQLSRGAIPDVLGYWLFLLPFSYTLGFLPAVLVGAIAGMVRPRIKGVWECLMVGLLGGVVAFGVHVAISSGGIYSLEAGIWMYGISGLLGGTLCAWLFRLPTGRSPGSLPLPGAD